MSSPMMMSKAKQTSAVVEDSITLPFIKMHGLGNDFVMLKSTDISPAWKLETLARLLCDRHFGIGADGLIINGEPTQPDVDARFVYLNSDGSWAEMCGNGIRCFARFLRDQHLVNKDELRIETLAGLIQPTINADGSVTVNMGQPIFEAERIPFVLSGAAPDQPVQNLSLSVLEQNFPISLVSMGNPHCLIFQDDLATPLDPSVFGPAVETHAAFPKKTNVEFLKVVDAHTLDCTVWERGCGFTLACGTGACASAVAAIRLGKAKSPVTVNLPGGQLIIEWEAEEPVYMTGPATYAFEGTIALPRTTLLQ